MITTDELRALASSTHPLHGDLVRVAKELLELRGKKWLADVSNPALDELDQLRAENAALRAIKPLLAPVLDELDRLRAELDQRKAQHMEDVGKCSATINALRAEVERLIGEKFAMEAKINAAIMGQRSLHSDMIARWDEMRDVILHGIDGLDNDQTNSVLGCIDDFYPTDIKPCSTSEESSVTAQSPAVVQMVEALEEARYYVAVYGNGGRPNELLDQMRAALDAAKGISK